MKTQSTGLFATVTGHGDAHAFCDDARLVAAVVYRNERYPDDLFRQIIDVCRCTEVAMAGVQQHLAYPEIADRRCDVYLEDLSTGVRTALFENRGSEARGCRLDGAALADVTAGIEKSLAAKPGLLVLNKFGKSEAEGEGMRDLIAKALDQGIPVIIGVPERNLAAFRDFAGELSVELSVDVAAVLSWLRRVQPAIALAASAYN
jgi:hypothetical protein